MESAKQTQSHGEEKKKERFLDFLRAAAAPSKELWLHRRLGVAGAAPNALLRRVAATLGARSATVDWRALRARCKAWARQPSNAALLVWLAFVAGGVALVLLLMTGALNSAVPDASRRRRWTEAANQVLNALFTVMCVYQHPRLCHHLVLLLRWRRDADADELRAVYCKNSTGCAGTRRRERLHVAVVLLLLHATCLAQYAYCALFWVFGYQTRPDWAVNLCMALGLGFPVAAALYMVYGPLGRKTVVLPAASTDEDASSSSASSSSTAVKASQSQRNNGGSGRVRVAVTNTKTEWAGGLMDLAADPAAAALSLACTFCVFGWNMERLGLGNAYVHAATLALLCAAPALVFAVAALSIHDATLGPLVGAAGALLSVLGLLYGGFWRARMRTRLGLPADDRWSTCGGGGRPAAADDYAKWLLCAPCALAQEVRTGNLYEYDVEEGNNLVSEEMALEEDKPAAMAPLEREGCVAPPWKAGGGDGVAVDAPPVLVMVG